jgi:hypothetical protein
LIAVAILLASTLNVTSQVSSIEVRELLDQFEREVLANNWDVLPSFFMTGARVSYRVGDGNAKNYSVPELVASYRRSASYPGYVRRRVCDSAETVPASSDVLVRCRTQERINPGGGDTVRINWREVIHLRRDAGKVVISEFRMAIDPPERDELE